MANPFQSIVDQTNISRNPGTGVGSFGNFASLRDNERLDRRNADITSRLNSIGRPQGGGQGGGGGGDVLNNAAARDQKILDETFGFRDQVLSDPSQQQALDFLSGVIDGGNQPFNQEVRSSILSGASDQAANSAANQERSIIQNAARAGLSPNDPAVQARLGAVRGQQGIQGQQALQNLNQQANIHNFSAQQQAANDISRQRLAQLNLGGQFGSQGVNLLAQRNIGQQVGTPQIFNQPQQQPQQQAQPQFNFRLPPRAAVPTPIQQQHTPTVNNTPNRFNQGEDTPDLSQFSPQTTVPISSFNQFGDNAVGPGGF